jgi:transposase InsO family protein
VEEQEARPESPPAKGPGRSKYPPEHREAILKALAAWQGTRMAFCLEHKVHHVTLWSWERASKGIKRRGTKPTKTGKKQSVYTPEQRRKAVESFSRSGQSLLNFGKAWGINAQVLGRWVKAHKQHGPKALEGRRAGRKKGRKPVAAGIREGIKQVKEQFPSFGIRKVGAFLARFKGLKASRPQIRRVVEEEKLPLGKTSDKRWRNKPVIRRFERSKPGELWQTDITSFVLPRYSQRVYLVAFMDDYSRYVVAWKLGVKQTTDFVQEALLEGIQRFGKPEELLSDQGRQYFAWRGRSEFQKLLTKQGIRHVVSRAHHPETLGKCERFWGTVGEEFWSRVEPLELLDAQERLAHFINHYYRASYYLTSVCGWKIEGFLVCRLSRGVARASHFQQFSAPLPLFQISPAENPGSIGQWMLHGDFSGLSGPAKRLWSHPEVLRSPV